MMANQFLTRFVQFGKIWRRLFAYKKPKTQFIRIKHVLPTDYEKVNNFLHKNYYPHEPTMMAAGLGCKPNKYFDEKALEMLSEGYSLMAVCCPDNTLAGVAVNCTNNPWEPDRLAEQISKIKCKNTAQLFRFYIHIMRAPDLWKKYDVTQIFETCIIAVHPENRCHQVATSLAKASVELAKDLGYKIARIDATNRYTACLCERLKFELEYKLPYASYVNQECKQIYFPPAPHKEVRVYVKHLHQCNKNWI